MLIDLTDDASYPEPWRSSGHAVLRAFDSLQAEEL